MAQMTEPANVVYIAGRMRGLPDCGREAFAKAETRLRGMGYRVINPGMLPTDLPEERYMPICLSMLEQADLLVLLDGWQYSDGAKLEYQMARMTGKEIVLESNVENWVDDNDATPIGALNLSPRAMNALLRGGVRTIGRLKQVVDAEPGVWQFRFRAMGKKLAAEVEEALIIRENWGEKND